MALEGTLNDFPLPDIIQLLSLSRKTGSVEIVGTDGFGTGKLFFQQGRVVSASLRDLSPLEAAFEFFTFPNGTFRFLENDPPPGNGPAITVSNESLIIDGIRRADEWDQVRGRVESLDMVLGLVTDPVAGSGDINLKPDEWRVLTMINGRETIRQIARKTEFGDFKTARIIYQLLDSGLIEPLGVATPPEPPVAAPPEPLLAPEPPAPEVAVPPEAPPVANGTTPPAAYDLSAAPSPAPVPTLPLGGTMPALPAVAPISASTVPLLPRSSGRTDPPPIPGLPLGAGAALYARLESVATTELGNSGRLLLSEAYKRLRLLRGADLGRGAALTVCDQFERDAGMLVGSARARALAEQLRLVVDEFYRG